MLKSVRITNLFQCYGIKEHQTPFTFTSRVDPVRLDDQFWNNKWEPSPISSFSMGNFGAFGTPMEREIVRKNVQVNYIDGSDDKKWSKRVFSWTKKLEVCGICHFYGFTSFTYGHMVTINGFDDLA